MGLKHLTRLGLGIVGLLWFLGLHTMSIAQVKPLPLSIPPEIRVCLPKFEIPKGEDPIEWQPYTISAVQHKGKKYYLVFSYYEAISPFVDEPPEIPYFQGGRFVVRLDDIGCLTLNEPEAPMSRSLTHYVSEEIARGIALGRWKRALALEHNNDLDSFRNELLKYLKPGPWQTFLYKEDDWALKQLGVTVPEKYINP